MKRKRVSKVELVFVVDDFALVGICRLRVCLHNYECWIHSVDDIPHRFGVLNDVGETADIRSKEEESKLILFL